jgi:hypothetical protein
MAGPGDALLQGSQNLAQGLNNYGQMLQTDAAATGQINAFLQQAQANPQAFASLSPNAQTLLQKQVSGKATMNDRISLLGEMTAGQQIQQQQTAMALQQQQAQAQALQNQMMQRRMQYLQQLMGNGGSSSPTQPMDGGPPQTAQGPTPPPAGAQQFLNGGAPPQLPGNGPFNDSMIRPPVPLTITDPRTAPLMQRALQMSMGDPEAASKAVQQQLDQINQTANAQYAQAVGVKKDTGRLVYAGPKYENGIPTFDTYNNEVVTAPGTPVQGYDRGDKVVSFKHGITPPQPVVFQPGQGTPSVSGEATSAQETINAASPIQPNDPEFQKSLLAAKQNAAASATALSDANLLYNAAQAYTNGGASNLNALRGNPAYAKFASIFSGGNPQASMQTALAANTQAILAQVRTAQGGTVGGRMLQTEFENTAKLLANPEMDNPTILGAAHNIVTLAQRNYDLQNAYASYHENMAPADAESLAVKQYGAPPTLWNPTAVDELPAPAIAALKANVAQAKAQRNPQLAAAHMRAFQQAMGDQYEPGMVEMALVK